MIHLMCLDKLSNRGYILELLLHKDTNKHVVFSKYGIHSSTKRKRK